jgi:hypothetical protein
MTPKSELLAFAKLGMNTKELGSSATHWSFTHHIYLSIKKMSAEQL